MKHNLQNSNNVFIGIISVSMLFALWVGCGKSAAVDHQEETTAAAQGIPAPTPTLPPVRPNLLSKEPDYWTYRAPRLECPDPMSEGFLQTYSPKWVAKSKDIDAQIAQISDPELRRAQKVKLQTELDPAQFRAEATKAYEAAEKDYQQKRVAFFNAHSDQWVEVAQYFDFSTSDQIVQFGKSAESPYNIELLTLKVDIPVIDDVFSKFRAELQTDIDSAASAKWQLILSRVNPNEFYAGLSQSEIDALVAKEKKKTWDQAEQELRRSRLMLVVQGDIINKRFTRLAFLNQMTGDVLYEFPSAAIKAVRSQMP